MYHLSSLKRSVWGLMLILVQVLHPGLVHQVQMDLFLMKMGSRLIGLLPGFKWLSLTEIVEEFEKLMMQQVLKQNCPLSCYWLALTLFTPHFKWLGEGWLVLYFCSSV